MRGPCGCVDTVSARGVSVFIVPLTAEVDWPAPAPLQRLVVATKVVPVPETVVAAVPVAHPAPVLPNVIAPTTLEPPREVPIPVGPVYPDLPPTGTGTIDPNLLGPHPARCLRLDRRDKSRDRRHDLRAARVSASRNESPARRRNTLSSRATHVSRGLSFLKP